MHIKIVKVAAPLLNALYEISVISEIKNTKNDVFKWLNILE